MAKNTASDIVLRDKAFNVAKNLKYNGYQILLDSLVYNFFGKRSAGSGIKKIKQNQQLAKRITQTNY